MMNPRRRQSRPLVRFTLVVLCLQVPVVASAAAQVKDEVRVYAEDIHSNGVESVLRVDRKLGIVGVVSTQGQGGGSLNYSTPMAVDGLGRSWVAFDPLTSTKLLRIDNSGVLLPSAILSTNPVNVAIDGDGRAYATSRIGLSAPGPAYGVSPDGAVLWTNISGPALYNLGYPQQLAVTAQGEVWLADGTVLVAGQKAVPYMVQLDTNDGHVVNTLALPGSPTNHTGVCRLAPSGDGTLWAFACAGTYRWMFKTQGTTILQGFPIDGGKNNASYQICVDAHDRLYVLSLYNEQGAFGTQLLRYDPASPALPDDLFQFGGIITGWALGASGEDVFAVIAPPDAPLTRRLERMNLVSHVKSSMPLDPDWHDCEMAYGDTTGFLYANVIDRQGDNDGDGVPNRGETLAGSSPFDPLSRPSGPKIYVSFAQSNNAIILKFVDPDGLLNSTGGLSASTFSVKLEPFGEISQFLLSFLTFVQVSPDGTSATVLFGALPMASDLKRRLEVTIADKTGAIGWDFQVTPPGDL